MEGLSSGCQGDGSGSPWVCSDLVVRQACSYACCLALGGFLSHDSLTYTYTHIRTHIRQDVSQEALCAKVASLCADSAVDGVIVQLPLPKHLDEEVIGALSTGNRDFLAG
jgi:hypothetical protein